MVASKIICALERPSAAASRFHCRASKVTGADAIRPAIPAMIA
jgi:hypothetical protein